MRKSRSQTHEEPGHGLMIIRFLGRDRMNTGTLPKGVESKGSLKVGGVMISKAITC
jgi:hypothetical protein